MRLTSLLPVTEIFLLATITTSLSSPPSQPLQLTIRTPSIFHRRPSINSIVKTPFKLGAVDKIDDNDAAAVADDTSPTAPIVDDNSFMSLPEPQFSPDEDKAFREVLKGLQKDGTTTTNNDLRWFDRSDVWTEAKASYPVLSSYTDAQLKRAYFGQKTSLVDVLLYTPVGPVFALNILAWYFHFSWCDTPFSSFLGASCSVVST